ncbi:hypothetical protein HYN69_18785 (plasmid) [Gemmobacter aquarius]|uniref:Uncharacterized protein n=1 Tax=Paragemmobacter aquarius TaxID=2169400 RepID=A0A2S0US62_9RHOB|nr:hypothetical protein HYN69_18785 [Gemmobacter aquarius]
MFCHEIMAPEGNVGPAQFEALRSDPDAQAVHFDQRFVCEKACEGVEEGGLLEGERSGHGRDLGLGEEPRRALVGEVQWHHFDLVAEWRMQVIS